MAPRRFPWAILICAAAPVAAPGAPQWYSAWTAPQGLRLAASLSGSSVRMIVRPTVSAAAARVRIENTMGQSQAVFSAAWIGQVRSGAALAAGSNTRLTFNRSAGLTLAGAGAYGDPPNFSGTAFTRYAVSLDVAAAQDVSIHTLGLVTNYVATGARSADTAGAAYSPVPSGDTRTDNGALRGVPVPDLYNSASAPVMVAQAAPSILTYGGNPAVVLNQDYSSNVPGNCAQAGTAMVYLIGSGPLGNLIATGAAAPDSPLSGETLATTLSVGGSPAVAPFAGMAPAFAGLVQVNFTVPNLPAADYPLQATIGSSTSNQLLVTLR